MMKNDIVIIIIILGTLKRRVITYSMVKRVHYKKIY